MVVETYVANIRTKSKDLKRMGAPIADWILVALLLNNLDSKFKDFVHRLITRLDELPDFDEIVTILHEEDRLQKRDNKDQAMAAAMRKFQKEQDEKKSKSNNSNRGGRNPSTSRGNSNKNGVSGAKISKNPNSSNYKGEGEPPECSKCPPHPSGDKKRHWPYDCWTQHPERAPERFKNKPKANVAGTNDRPDDFVDRNDTHISAMARMTACEEDLMGDEEYWGLPGGKSTPNLGGSLPCVERTNEFFEQIFNSVENDEMEVSSPLLSSPKFGCDIIQTHESPPISPELFPDGEIIDCLSHDTSTHFLAYSAMDSQPTVTHDWTIDSGCTNHMYFDKEEFVDYQPFRAGITIADGNTVWAMGRGTVEMEWLLPDGSSKSVSLTDVLHVPGLTCGLFSISQATRKGLGVTFLGDDCKILRGEDVIGSAPKVHNTYILSVTHSTAKVASLIDQNMRALATSLMFNEEAVELWHRRMGHLNEADLKRLVNMSKGIMLTQKPRVRPICEACSRAKSSRKVPRQIQREVLEKLGKIHMDLGGPFNVPSINGAKYYMLLTDQATLRTWCFTFKHKDEVFKLFKDWKTEVETQSGCKVKIVRFDNGGEFINQEFKEHFKDSGIVWEPTVAYTPEQNGLSEVQNRIVMNGVRAMLFDSRLSRYLWSELLHTKVYQKNRSPTTRLKGITPHEAWTGEKPFLGHMRIIGCVAWVHIPKEKRKKLDERSKKCYLVGYDGTSIFRVWNPATGKVERASHVDFDESRLITAAVSDTGYWMAEATGDDVTDVLDAGGEPLEHRHTTDGDVVANETPTAPDIERIQSILSGGSEVSGDVGAADAESEQESLEEPQIAAELHPDPSPDGTYTSRPKRLTQPSQKVLLNEKWGDTTMWAKRAIAHSKCLKTLESERLYCRQATLSVGDPNHHDFEPEFDLMAAVQEISEMRSYQATVDQDDLDDCEPLTYQQAMGGPYAKQWKDAMDKQMKSFATMGTWKLVPCPENAPILTGKWVYRIKKRLDGSILYKARWVVRGFEQVYGVNYDQTFASVVKSMSYKVLFAIMAYYDLDCEQMDVITGFLNAQLKEKVHVQQPTGYEEGDLVCLLLRALYGLKQAPREWYFTLRDFLISIGFKHTESDHSLFVNESLCLIVSVYVDDIQIFGPKGSKEISKLKKELHRRFAMTDLGPCAHYLGMEIQRCRTTRTVRITQEPYLKKVLNRFGMANCASAPTPMVAGTQLKEELVDQAPPDVIRLYQSMVGSVMYAMIQTRPDICFAVTVLSRYNRNPNASHMAAIKRVLRYLKGTLDYGITYGNASGLEGFTDADWASDQESRRSLGAYVFLLYGGAVSWSSKRQQSIALSSCEAEYMAQTQAAKEAIWLTRLFSELDIGFGLPKAPILIKADNQGAIALASDPRFHSRTKHIDIQWHFVRDQVETGAIEFEWVRTNDMVADGLTKTLTNDKFKVFVSQIGLERP